MVTEPDHWSQSTTQLASTDRLYSKYIDGLALDCNNSSAKPSLNQWHSARLPLSHGEVAVRGLYFKAVRPNYHHPAVLKWKSDFICVGISILMKSVVRLS